MKDSTKGLLSIVLAISFVIFIGWMIYKNWTTGAADSDYKIVCIGGHQYYRANFVQKALLGIRLTDDGKPIKCNGEQI